MKRIYKVRKHREYVKIVVVLVLASSILLSVAIATKINIKNIFSKKNIAELANSDNKSLTEENASNTEISVSEEGYTFIVKEAKLSEESLVITGTISGPEIAYKDGVFPADVEIVPKDFKEGWTAEGGDNKFKGSGDTYTFKIEEKYKPGEVESFLAKGQKYITLDVMIYRRNDLDGVTSARKVYEEDLDKRDYRVYWKESDRPIKEFKSIDVPYNYK